MGCAWDVEGVAERETAIREGSITGGKSDGVGVRVGVFVGVNVEVGVAVGVAVCVEVGGGVGDCACATTAVAVNGSADGLHAAIIKQSIPRIQIAFIAWSFLLYRGSSVRARRPSLRSGKRVCHCQQALNRSDGWQNAPHIPFLPSTNFSDSPYFRRLRISAVMAGIT